MCSNLIHFPPTFYMFFMFLLWEALFGPLRGQLSKNLLRPSNKIFLWPIRCLSNFINELKQQFSFEHYFTRSSPILDPKKYRKVVQLSHSSLHRLKSPSICKSIIHHCAEVVLLRNRLQIIAKRFITHWHSKWMK